MNLVGCRVSWVDILMILQKSVIIGYKSLINMLLLYILWMLLNFFIFLFCILTPSIVINKPLAGGKITVSALKRIHISVEKRPTNLYLYSFFIEGIKLGYEYIQ